LAIVFWVTCKFPSEDTNNSGIEKSRPTISLGFTGLMILSYSKSIEIKYLPEGSLKPLQILEYNAPVSVCAVLFL